MITSRGVHGGGDRDTCLPPLTSAGFLAIFSIHAVLCSYKVAYREKRAASGSRTIGLLLSKLHYIMLLLQLHDVTTLPEVAVRSIIN